MKLLILLLALAAAPLHSKPGFYGVAQKDGRWWLTDPQGKPFFCNAVNAVGIGPSLKDYSAKKPNYAGLRHYKDAEAWSAATLQRLNGWGYNTLGGYSDLEFAKKSGWPYTISLVMGALLGIPWIDPGSPESLTILRTGAKEALKYRGDPNLIGYFIDNELGWWDESMVTFWMTQPVSARPKRALLKILKADYQGDLKALANDFSLSPVPQKWKDLEGTFKVVTFTAGSRPASVEKFIAWFAEEYYAIVAAELRKVDPDHMLLGDRYLSYYAPEVARAAGKHMDVVSANYNTYSENGWISPAFFDGLYALTGKPIMVTEFYFSAMENSSGNPNSHGPFIIVKTQKERAQGAAAMATTLAGLPYVVGHHWFEFNDEPRFGRDDGEDFNFGLVDIEDRPYALLTTSLSAANHTSLKDHAAARGFVVQTPRTIPRASKLSNDGYLGDWNLKAAWLGTPRQLSTTSSPPLPSPADFYAAWTPEGLWLGLAFQDFDASEKTPELPLFLMTVSHQGYSRTFSISEFQNGKAAGPRLIGGKPRFPALKLVGKGPLKGSVASKEAVSVTTLSEIFLSGADLGGGLAMGESVELKLSLKLKGGARQWDWSGKLALGQPWN